MATKLNLPTPMMTKNTIPSRSIMLILFLYPIMLLPVRGSTNFFIFILFILSLYIWYRQNLWVLLIKDRSAIYFAIAMSSVIVATLASQAYHSSFDSLYWDSPSRFLIAIPIFFALKNSSIRIIPVLRYCLPLGAISALCTGLVVQHYGLSEFGSRASNMYLNPIHFGNLSLVLAMLSVCSIRSIKLADFRENILPIFGLLAGLSASIISGTRGGWIAIPVVMIAWIFIGFQADKAKRLIIGALAIVAVVVGGYFGVDIIHQRVNDSFAEAVAILNGDLSSSFGQRIELWIAGFYMFKENLLFGVGPDGFFSTLLVLRQSGIVHSFTQATYGTEVHSYFIACIAELGLWGLSSAIAIFVVPLTMFIKVSNSKNEQVKTAARMGVCFVLSFFIFCLTVEMFNIKMIAAFYALTVAVLLAAATAVQTD